MTTGKGDFSPFLLNSGLCMANLTAIFVAGDVLKKKSFEIGRSLCNLDIRQMPEKTANEVAMLLLSIENRLTGVQLGGLFYVNLPSLVSVISAITNSIVVIVQLKSSSS
ncbi:Hypothetical protein NTJ_10848 [Nesidiocoris tenuis]|uniref:Uncharacterized protein n=1 Tax=Nesidiocoris tenuis TaxID=355587 RepID=A0ABN7B1B3_9HEMI|nr:Hypothetical protein NTJ_10848 [Nesidiocoris tenuis]